jgi:voltage-gated potassium channel Kch
VLPPGNTTTQFDVESRASGTFPVLVTVSSPDGGLTLQRSRYTIRSAFVSGVGVFLAVGAGLFLAVWWLTHWRRSRRAGTPALAS